MADAVVVERTDGPVRTLELNRPERLNAVSLPLYDQLIEAIGRAVVEPAIRVIVLTGGGRAFCVGADLKAHGEAAPDDTDRRRYVAAAQLANRTLQECPLPVVAAVNGHAIGAGLELALSSDVIIVADEAKLRLPEVSLGTFIGGGVSYTLPMRVGSLRAKELIFFGRFFLGRDAETWGLANRSVPASDVLTTAMEWAGELAQQAPLSLAAAKRLLRAPAAAVEQALAHEAQALLDIMKSEDWQEGVDAFAERRTPRFNGR